MADNYKISRERLENIANRVRVMAGLTRKMTPAEIVDWLSKVKFMPMAIGESEFSLNFNFTSSTASGILPSVAKEMVNSELVLPTFESTAMARIPMVVRTTANSTVVLPTFESSAVGILQEE